MSITVTGLGFAYGKQPVLHDVGFSLQKGDLVAVLGPNGTGKTTLFQCILGLRQHDTGTITIDGACARSLSARERAHRIAFVPQAAGEALGYSVFEMVLMGTAHDVSPFSTPRQHEKEAAWAALRRLEIGVLAKKRFAHLSGGERQLVLIARALAQQAKILILDEPTASLDYGNQARVLTILRGLAQEGYAVLFSTHNPQHALSLTNRVLALSKGRVAAYGTPGEVMNADLIKQLYGVQAQLIKTEAGLFILPEFSQAAI